MATILMTGATGAVGRCLVPRLRRRGHRLILLVRPGIDGGSAADRARGVFGDALDPRDVCWPGDVHTEGAGVPRGRRDRWRGRIDHVVHAAGSISFDAEHAEATRRTNLDGTANVLALAADLGVASFHHLSTVFVAGDAERYGEDDLRVGQNANNPYESSKLEAEERVRAWRGGRWTIHRLGILIGDSRTGESAGFHGFYGFMRQFWRLRARLRRRWAADPAGCREAGFRFDGQGLLRLPVNVPCSPTASLNLVPSDWLSDTLARLIDLPATGATYHLAHPSPPRVRWALLSGVRRMRIAGLCFDAEPSTRRAPAGLLDVQRSLDEGLARFAPYVRRGPDFSVERVSEVLGRDYEPPPPIDEALLGRVMDYAMRTDFGRDVPSMALPGPRSRRRAAAAE